ncbi:hypothetical protein B0H11DRAFT_1997322 [Mycena galericulata]|nr:hypothetical protein B0H11DRAFT_1997322 [Mycena galericulata]
MGPPATILVSGAIPDILHTLLRVLRQRLCTRQTPHDSLFHQWRLKGDPTLVRHELCELLAEKAPHHNPTSWSSYWSSHHELPDKILASIRTQELQVLRRPIRYDPSPGSELTEESEDEEDGEDDIPIPPVERSVDLEEGGSNSLTSKKRKLDDTDVDDDEKAKKRKVASVPNEGKANRNTVAEIATRVRSTTKGAEVWAKAEQLLGTEKEYLFQNPEAFEVWVRRHQLQWRFLMSREYDILTVNALFTAVEESHHIDSRCLLATKIRKVMHQISRIEDDVPGDDEYNFRQRARDLVVRWDQILDASTAFSAMSA